MVGAMAGRVRIDIHAADRVLHRMRVSDRRIGMAAAARPGGWPVPMAKVVLRRG
jgi:hypothetical protein